MQKLIRETLPGDFDTLVALTGETGVFKPNELVALREVLDDWTTHNKALGHRSVTSLRDDRIVGFAYYAPAAMTDRTWYLYWIAVTKQVQARGLGTELLHYLEHDIQAAKGRVLFIETSSLPHYEPTRRFYHKHGYEQGAKLADYYADGDHMIVFRKKF